MSRRRVLVIGKTERRLLVIGLSCSGKSINTRALQPFLSVAGAVGGVLTRAARAAGYEKLGQIATLMVLHPEFGRAPLWHRSIKSHEFFLSPTVRRLIRFW